MQVELGFTDPASNVYMPIGSNGDIPFFAGFQGLSELFVTLRVADAPTAQDGTSSIDVAQTVTLVGSGQVLHEFTERMVLFAALGPEQVELSSRRLILDSPPSSIDGQIVELAFTLSTEVAGRTVSSDFSQGVRLVLSN